MDLLEKYNLLLSNKDHKLEDNIMIKITLILSQFFPILTFKALKILKIYHNINNQFKILMNKQISLN